MIVQPPPTATVTMSSAPPPPRTEDTGYRGLGLGLGIVGVLGIGVGTGFGIAAMSKWNDNKGNCDLTSSPKTCPPDTQKQVDRARNFATVSNLGFGLGGALLVAGIVLVATSGSSTDTTKTGYSRTWHVSPSVGKG